MRRFKTKILLPNHPLNAASQLVYTPVPLIPLRFLTRFPSPQHTMAAEAAVEAPAAAEPGPVVESKTEDAPVAEGVEGSPAPASQGTSCCTERGNAKPPQHAAGVSACRQEEEAPWRQEEEEECVLVDLTPPLHRSHDAARCQTQVAMQRPPPQLLAQAGTSKWASLP